MISQYHKLPHQSLNPGTLITHNNQNPSATITLADQATSVMTDFNHTRPFSINTAATIDDINRKMIACGVRLLFVAEVDTVLLGLVTYNDIFGKKPVLYIQEHGGTREEILAQDVMTPLSQVEALLRSDVLKSRVGDIVETIKLSGSQHILVVDDTTDHTQKIAGLFSSTHIEKVLDIKIEISPRAKSFADLERKLTG